MSLLDPILEKLGLAESEEEEAEFRCIRCGAYHDRQYNSCPDCGGQFIVPLDGTVPDEGADPGAPGDT